MRKHNTSKGGGQKACLLCLEMMHACIAGSGELSSKAIWLLLTFFYLVHHLKLISSFANLKTAMFLFTSVFPVSKEPVCFAQGNLNTCWILYFQKWWANRYAFLCSWAPRCNLNSGEHLVNPNREGGKRIQWLFKTQSENFI